MAITFIPEIWSGLMLSRLEKSLVFAGPSVVNRDYEGDIADMGDTVRIRSMGDPTIGTYVEGTTTITPESLTDAQRALTITESKYFAFKVGDIAQAQSPGGELDEGLRNAAYGLRDVADQLIAAKYTEAAAANQIGTVSVTSADLAYTQLRQLKVALDEANAPQEGRYAIVPPWYHGLLLENAKFVEADKAGTDSGLRNGMVGRALGFDVLTSNNCVNVVGDDFAVMAGVPGAIAFAEQINKVEAYRPENSFADALKGLHLYGGKVLRPDALATVIASKT